MQVALLTNEESRKELEEKGLPPELSIMWVSDFDQLINVTADAYFDLFFVNTTERITCLAKLLPKPVFINAVSDTLDDIGQPFIRINAWAGFLKRKIIEIAVNNQYHEKAAEVVLTACNWPFKIVPDVVGMIAPRVLAMIVNEAYYALDDEISTKPEIDIAMKTGTNYPYGPFEWSRLIGLENIYTLLKELSKNDKRYLIADSMIKDL